MKKEVKEIINNLKDLYNLTDEDIFYTRGNDDAKVIYQKDNIKIYYCSNYNYIDIVESEVKI